MIAFAVLVARAMISTSLDPVHQDLSILRSMQELLWAFVLPGKKDNKHKHTASIANTNIPVNKQSSRAGS